MSGAMAKVGEDFTEYFGSAPFASRGSIYGQAWPALSQMYKEWKADEYPGRPIMVLTGELKKSFEFRASTQSVKITNTAEHFRDHQMGIGVPQRVIMAMNEDREKAARSIINDDIRDKIGRLL